MNTYDNRPLVHLTPPDDAFIPSPQPLIRPLPCVTPGLRAYSLGGDAKTSITVTEVGHWFHTADKLAMADDAPVGWACRGCGVVATSSLLDPQLGRCPKAWTAQSVASALLATFPRPRPVAPRALYGVVCAE